MLVLQRDLLAGPSSKVLGPLMGLLARGPWVLATVTGVHLVPPLPTSWVPIFSPGLAGT